MYVIARQAKTSTGVQYVKAFEFDKLTELMSNAHIYYTEYFAKEECAKMSDDFKVIKIR